MQSTRLAVCNETSLFEQGADIGEDIDVCLPSINVQR